MANLTQIIPQRKPRLGDWKDHVASRMHLQWSETETEAFMCVPQELFVLVAMICFGTKLMFMIN